MRKRTIVIDFSQAGIDEAIKELQDYAEELDRRYLQFTEELAKAGFEVSQREMAIGNSKGDGNSNATVSLGGARHLWIISAKGHDVCFIEFGAGTAAGQNPIADNVPFDTGAGSWSRNNGSGSFANTGKWRYNDAFYTFIQPTMPMYKGAKAMQDRNTIMRIAQEVFQ